MTTEPTASPPTAEDEASGPGVSIGRLVVGAVLVLVGALWLLDASGVADLRWRVVLPAALTVVGVALLASVRRGAHGGLIATGLVLGVLVLASSATPITGMAAGVGEREERPTTLDLAEAGYELGVGNLRVDLREIEDLRDGATIPVSVGVGEVVVHLPEGVGADVEASVGIGEATVLGRSRRGLGVSVSEAVRGDPRVVLEVSVGIGQVEVRR